MFRRALVRLSEEGPKPFPKTFFDLKAFRKGISEKKQSLLEAERRIIDRVYAKPAPEGWSIKTFLEKAKVAQAGEVTSAVEVDRFNDSLSACFTDWNDFISSTKKDLFKVSHILNADQSRKLATAIELFNHGLFSSDAIPADPALSGKVPDNESLPWGPDEDDQLIHLAVHKYDYTFGDCWLYVAFDMKRSPDSVMNRFSEIYLKPLAKEKTCEITLSKSFRPLLMNRQFRLVPPQCYIVPSEENFPSHNKTRFTPPPAFEKYYRSAQ